jgi:hypothetical protein
VGQREEQRPDLERVFFGVGSAFPPPSAQTAPPQNRVPRPEDVTAMMAALPDSAPVKPKQPRRVLVLAKAAGFVHSSIPLAARTIEEIGKKTGAWSTTITYDAADIKVTIELPTEWIAKTLAIWSGAVRQLHAPGGRRVGRHRHRPSCKVTCSITP